MRILRVFAPPRLIISCCLLAALAHAQTPPYLNPDLPAETRAADLVARMTLDERVLQMQNGAPVL
ncbi:MAG TPA: hypothetical protein VKE70_36855, partial [Candidatus Solibacter sp.]|nr:hypothetical protein [Candidatus Solibacter sp.]